MIYPDYMTLWRKVVISEILAYPSRSMKALIVKFRAVCSPTLSSNFRTHPIL